MSTDTPAPSSAPTPGELRAEVERLTALLSEANGWLTTFKARVDEIPGERAKLTAALEMERTLHADTRRRLADAKAELASREAGPS